MTSDQEVRMAAAQAAASCARTLEMGDLAGVIRVAEMWEAYITQGSKGAHQVIATWPKTDPKPHEDASSPVELTAPDGSGPSRDTSPQELADEAYLAETSGQVESIIKRSEKGGFQDEMVTIDGITGPLFSYLGMLLRQIGEAETVVLVPRNDSLRSELGL